MKSKYFLLVILFLFIVNRISASHAAGMDLTYECLTTDTVWTGNYQVNIATGAWGIECSWNIIDDNTGAIIASGSGYNNNSTYTINVCLPSGSYTFNWFDSFGDGWNGGSYTVTTNTGAVLTSGSPPTGSSGSSIFTSPGSSCNYTITNYPVNTYRVTLKFYRDCSNGIPAPSTFSLDYNSNNCGSNNSATMNQVYFQNITPVCASISDPCSSPGVVGIEEYVYQTIITLPNNCNDWIFSVCEAARNGAITTINNPGQQDLCVQSELNNTQYCNNSPIFTEYPTPYLCVGQQFCYNNGAIDPDGDSLVYTLVTPLNSAAGGTINYNGGFSAFNPISGATTFDPLTGDLCMLATQVQVSVVAMKVSEFRNGLFIGSVIRDIQIIVLSNCSTTPPVLTGINGAPQDVTTATVSDITIDHCSNGIDPVIFTINAPLGTSNNKTMTWGGLSGSATNSAAFPVTSNNSNNPSGTFTWIPDYADVPNSPFFFTVTVVDDACPINNSFSFTYTLNLTSNSGFTVQDLIANESCPGNNDGAIDITITGISGTPAFLWSGPNGFSSVLEDISGLSSGVYVLELTSPDGCIVSYNYNVLSSSVSLSETHSDPTCSGSLDGSINILVSGGVSPYTYSWIDSISGSIYSTEDLINIGSGNYWCTITDANGCSALPFQVIITTPNAISTNSTLTEITCFGAADGGIALNATGGNPPLSISWIGPNGFSSTLDSLVSLGEGTYYAVITDADSCSLSPVPFFLTEPFSFSASYIASDISCFGLNNGSIDLSIQGGVLPYSVTWQGPNGFFSNTEDITNLNPGLYNLSVTDANLCLMASAIQVLISEPNDITYSTTPTNVSCYGEQDGAIDLVLNGGVGFITTSWIYPNGVQINSEDLNGLSSGTYTFTITDADGCTPTVPPTPIFITEQLQIVIMATIQNEQCYGDADGLIDITVTNANGPFDYNWMGPLSFSSTLSDIAGLNAGSYQITVTDNSNLCTNDTSLVISLGSQIQIQSNANNVNCFNGTDGFIDLIPQGLSNPLYAWSNGGITEDISNLSAGNYSVLVNDDANCPAYFSFVINQPGILGLTSNVTEVSCPGGNNGNIDVLISGGTLPYNYIWSNGNIAPINQSLTEGLYVVSVYDVNNCVVQASFQLVAEDFHVDAMITDPQCFGATDGLVDVEIIGGDYPFTYIWSNGQTNQDVINLSAGLYSLSITDALNCTIDTLIFVNQPPLINAITTTSNVICFGSNTGSVGITPTGGNPPYVVDWGGVDTSALYAGIYSYQISDLTGCIYNNIFSILPGDSIGISYVKTDVQCFGESTGMIDIQISPGSGMAPYQYSWTGPNLFSSSSEDISNLVAGIYVFQITDANNCTKEVHIVVGEPTISQIITTNTSDYTGSHIACKGDNSGWINLEIYGGYIPFTYAWNTGETTDSISNLYAGIYSVTVTDGLGCSVDYSFNLSEPTTVMSGAIYATTDYNNYEVRCYGNNDGAIKETVTGGAGNYTYQWNNGYNTDSLFNLSAGYYEVAVYDNNGCLWMDSIILNEPDPLALSIVFSTDTCERNIGYAEVSLSGGLPIYTYLWSSGQTTAGVYDLAEGIYEVVAIDKNLCEISDVAVIENLRSPKIDFKRLPKHKRFYDQIDNPFVFVDVSDTYWQGIVDWQWDFGDNTTGEDSIVFHSYAVAGEYTISLAIETEYNCWDTISKKIVIDEYEIFIPNTFTPSTGDVINNEFKAYGYGIANYTMKIYNRWGEILFESNDINRGWNGTTRNGKNIAPIGVYLYFIEVENIYGEIFIYQDALNIMR